MRRSIATAGLALAFLSLCQNQYVHADRQQFEAPSTETIQKDENNNEGYFDDDDDDDRLDDSLPAPAHNRAAYPQIPDKKIVDDQQSEESPDLPEDSDTPPIPESTHPMVDSDTPVLEPETIQGEHDIKPEVESEGPGATEDMESRAFDEPPTEDSVVSDDAAIPAPATVESQVPLSKEVEKEEPHTAELNEDSGESDDANEASSREKVVEPEAPSTVDEGHPDEQVNDDIIPSEKEDSNEPKDQKPQVRNEEPDDDPSFIDLDDAKSADSSPEQRSRPPEDKLPPSVDAHATEETRSEEEVEADAEKVIDSAEDLDDQIEEESTPKEIVNVIDVDGEEPSQPSEPGLSDQDEDLGIKAHDLKSNEETTESEPDKESESEAEDVISKGDDGDSRKETTEKPASDAEQPSQPKSGSLASFFNKVSAEPEKASDTMTKATKMQDAAARLSKKDEVPEDDVHMPYCGVWGVFRWARPAHADLSTLFLLFQDYFMSDSDDAGKLSSGTKMDITDMASIMTDEIMRQGQQKLEQTLAAPQVSEIADAAKPNKSVNHEFVEGLDDIDKLFEGVDPPDELDVGAAGSSMQEVLMGQGTRILLKRISIGAQLVKKTTISLKDKVVERFQNKDFKITLPEKEEALRVAKQVPKQAAQWVWTSSQQVFHIVQAILDDMLEGEDLDDLEFDIPRPPAGAQKDGTQEQDEEMEQLLRQWRGSENR
jgi:hypothetical protein